MIKFPTRCSSISFTCAVCDLDTSCFPEQRLFLLQPNLLSELASWFKWISANGNLIYSAKFCTSSFHFEPVFKITV